LGGLRRFYGYLQNGSSDDSALHTLILIQRLKRASSDHHYHFQDQLRENSKRERNFVTLFQCPLMNSLNSHMFPPHMLPRSKRTSEIVVHFSTSSTLQMTAALTGLVEHLLWGHLLMQQPILLPPTYHVARSLDTSGTLRVLPCCFSALYLCLLLITSC